MENNRITRKDFIKQLAVGSLAVSAGSGVVPRLAGMNRVFAAENLPNMVLINTDDLGYGDLECYGGKAIRTPRIDSLARNGVRFTDFHACDSVCSPSRAGLLTGRYPKRMGLDMPLMPENLTLKQKAVLQLGYTSATLGLMDQATEKGISGLNENEITLAEALRQRAYRTGMVGKWHLGDYSQNPGYNPLNHGFDFYFGVPHSNDMKPFPLFRNREQLEAHVTDQSKLTGLYTEEAIRFIEQSGKGPFFLYFAHTFPHRPLYASDAFVNRSEGGVFGDTVEEIDWSVGRILDTLKKNGLERNTIVMFTSDNGPWYQGSAGSLRGRKGQSYEGGHRVPFLARWPGRIPAGAVCRKPAMNIDLFPTLLNLAGIPLPQDRVIDGVDILPLLTGTGGETAHDAFYFYHHGLLEAVRVGNWKYIASINHYTWPLPVNRKLGHLSNYTTGPLPMLFNLERDVGESYNVIARYPEIAAELEAKMTRWQAQMEENPSGMH